MPTRERIVEVRLLVVVAINLADPSLNARLEAIGQIQAIAQVVADEVVANLESTSYVESAIATQL